MQKTQIYKSFGLKQVTKVYSDFNNGEEIYFLDSENNPVRVESISKELYDG